MWLSGSRHEFSVGYRLSCILAELLSIEVLYGNEFHASGSADSTQLLEIVLLSVVWECHRVFDSKINDQLG